MAVTVAYAAPTVYPGAMHGVCPGLAAAPELTACASFIGRCLARAAALPEDVAARAAMQLRDGLARRYAGHWHPAVPLLGSGFRCLEFAPSRPDPLFMEALAGAGVPAGAIAGVAAKLGMLTLWVDPGEVSMRCGDHGGITTIFSAAAAYTAAADTYTAPKRVRSPSPVRRSLSPTAKSFALPRAPMSPMSPMSPMVPMVPRAAVTPPPMRRAVAQATAVGHGRRSPRNSRRRVAVMVDMPQTVARG